MYIFVKTNNPQGLVDKIKESIDKKIIDTWSYDSEGDFTHSVEQWKYRAWMRPHIEKDKVVFAVICRRDKNMTMVEYAVYHGRFVEMLLRHFDRICTSIEVSPLGTKFDVISADNEQS